MKIALIGPKGNIGSAVLAELLARGHRVTALSRQPAAAQSHFNPREVQADALDSAQVARAVAGHDAVVNAYHPGPQHPQLFAAYMLGAKAIAVGTQQAGLKRLLVVGAADGLWSVHDSPLATLAHHDAHAMRDAIAQLHHEFELDWTVVSTAVGLLQASRCGRYRIGEAPGAADMAREDLALAIADEIESRSHLRKHLVVALRPRAPSHACVRRIAPGDAQKGMFVVPYRRTRWRISGARGRAAAALAGGALGRAAGVRR